MSAVTEAPAIDYRPLHEAVALLAGVCDYANTRDNVGFNGTDAWLGHAIADMGVDAWDDSTALTAWDMLRKYRNTQLRAAGIDYDELPVPPGAEELLEERKAEARERAKEQVREHREAQYRKAKSFVRCDGEDAEVILSFPFDWTLVAESKAITGRQYKTSYGEYSKVNVYPFTSLSEVIAFADKHDIPVTPEVRALSELAQVKHAEALKAAEQAKVLRAARPSITVTKRGALILDKDWDSDTRILNAALRELNNGRSTWDREAGVHRLPLRRNPAGLQKLIKEFALTMSDEARELINGEADRQEQNLIESKLATAEPLGEVRGLDPSVTIKPQQWPAIRWAVKHRRTWIGDDMGLGKSLSSLAAVAIEDAYPLVIVCMPSLTGNWLNELKRFPRLNVYVAEGQKATPIPYATDVVIIGSAALGYSPRAAKGQPKEFPWVKMISAIGPKALILDESQIAKEQSAARTKAIKELAAPIVEDDGLVYLLTGTAMMNRPSELGPQLEIMGRIDDFGGMGSYLMRYCAGESNAFGTKFDGAHHLDELHDNLRRWGIMVRRDKSILGLPPCNEIDLRVSTAELDPAVMAEYRKAERDVVEYLAAQAERLARKFGVDPTSARVRAAMKAQNAEHLVRINTLRGLIGKAKIEYAKRWTAEQVAKGEKVVLAAHHQPVTGALAEAFGGLKIVGDQTVKSKETDKYVFQNDPDAMVMTVAIEAGGTGHTLTAARTGLLVEQPWTPGGRNQMRDRFNRIGQTREMYFYTLLAEGTIDDHMYEVLTTKQARLDAVLDGKSSEGVADDEKSIAAEVAWRLAMEGFGGRA